MENENQDTVALLENCADVDKRGTRLPEAKGLHGIYCGEEVAEVHGRSQEVGRLQTALGWRVYDIRRGRNRVTRSSVRGDDKIRDKLCQRRDKVNKFRG
jgi:hypothetical protein